MGWMGTGMAAEILKVEIIQGVPKKWTFCICSICKELRNGFLNHFFLLKTETHMYILNTEPFLDDIRGLRYIQKKTWF